MSWAGIVWGEGNLSLSRSTTGLNETGCCHHHHHHHVMLLAQISLTLSHHFSPSFIASGRSSELHPVSSHSCCMHVRAGRPVFARPYVGVHRSTSLMSSSLLHQQCPACLVHLTWIVSMMGGRWPYSWCFVGCCHQDLFNIAKILKQTVIFDLKTSSHVETSDNYRMGKRKKV